MGQAGSWGSVPQNRKEGKGSIVACSPYGVVLTYFLLVSPAGSFPGTFSGQAITPRDVQEAKAAMNLQPHPPSGPQLQLQQLGVSPRWTQYSPRFPLTASMTSLTGMDGGSGGSSRAGSGAGGGNSGSGPGSRVGSGGGAGGPASAFYSSCSAGPQAGAGLTRMSLSRMSSSSSAVTAPVSHPSDAAAGVDGPLAGKEEENGDLMRGFGSFDDNEVSAAAAQATAAGEVADLAVTSGSAKGSTAAAEEDVGKAVGVGPSAAAVVAEDAALPPVAQQQGSEGCGMVGNEEAGEEAGAGASKGADGEEQQESLPEVPPLRLQGKLIADPSEEDVLQVRTGLSIPIFMAMRCICVTTACRVRAWRLWCEV